MLEQVKEIVDNSKHPEKIRTVFLKKFGEWEKNLKSDEMCFEL